MDENPYKAAVEEQVRTSSKGRWPRRLRRWSHGQPLALFYLFLFAIALFTAMLAPLLRR